MKMRALPHYREPLVRHTIGVVMGVVDVPFDLVEVKLGTPLTRPGTVAKTDVIERLSTSRARLVSVVAPAGYGKTTLLARWAEADPRPFAWVALDGQDDDAVVFLRHLAGAIHRVEPVPRGVFDALSGPGGRPGQNAFRVSGAHWRCSRARWC
jgi:LuxR family maltose regulon positive regulatory protein